MEVTTVAIDLAKNVFAVCGANAAGKVIWRKELRRGQLLGFMRKLAPCLGRNGSAWRGALLGAPTPRARP